MASGFYNVPKAVNEPVKSYAPNSVERKELLDTRSEERRVGKECR